MQTALRKHSCCSSCWLKLALSLACSSLQRALCQSSTAAAAAARQELCSTQQLCLGRLRAAVSSAKHVLRFCPRLFALTAETPRAPAQSTNSTNGNLLSVAGFNQYQCHGSVLIWNVRPTLCLGSSSLCSQQSSSLCLVRNTLTLSVATCTATAHPKDWLRRHTEGHCCVQNGSTDLPLTLNMLNIPFDIFSIEVYELNPENLPGVSLSAAQNCLADLQRQTWHAWPDHVTKPVYCVELDAS